MPSTCWRVHRVAFKTDERNAASRRRHRAAGRPLRWVALLPCRAAVSGPLRLSHRQWRGRDARTSRHAAPGFTTCWAWWVIAALRRLSGGHASDSPTCCVTSSGMHDAAGGSAAAVRPAARHRDAFEAASPAGSRDAVTALRSANIAPCPTTRSLVADAFGPRPWFAMWAAQVAEASGLVADSSSCSWARMTGVARRATARRLLSGQIPLILRRDIVRLARHHRHHALPRAAGRSGTRRDVGRCGLSSDRRRRTSVCWPSSGAGSADVPASPAGRVPAAARHEAPRDGPASAAWRRSIGPRSYGSRSASASTVRPCPRPLRVLVLVVALAVGGMRHSDPGGLP